MRGNPGNPHLFLLHGWVSVDLLPGELDWARLGQNLRLQDFVKLRFGEQALFQHQLVDAFPRDQRLLGHCGGIGIANVGV